VPTRTLTIKEEAYQALKSIKKENESFTDVILRLTSGKGDLNRLLEAMKNKEFHSPELAKNVEQASREFRKNFKLRKVEL
jgi:predicted CopG family antitoxin